MRYETSYITRHVANHYLLLSIGPTGNNTVSLINEVAANLFDFLITSNNDSTETLLDQFYLKNTSTSPEEIKRYYDFFIQNSVLREISI